MMVAGERSGDVYGGRLAAALRGSFNADFTIFGCGGDAMRHAGVETIVDAHRFAMVGITEVASGLPRAYRAFHDLLGEAQRRRPSLAILIDSPSLNMRLGKRLKRLGIPVLYFVSPQIWAWKKWRLRQLRGRIDKMVCIFDFEEPLYHRAGIPAAYVGHPLVDTVWAPTTRLEFVAHHGLDPGLPVVALLPGSRQIEMKYILHGMLEACQILLRRRTIQFVLAAAPALDSDMIQQQVRASLGNQAPVRVVSDAAYDALAHSTVAIVASGTATIEAALLERPMVVVYRVSPITAFFARRMVDVPFFSMVNILAGKSVVPELIQGDFTPSRLATEVERLMDSTGVQSEMVEEFREIRRRLGPAGAIDRVAKIVMEMLPASARRAAVEGGV
jgi:lipid-A-disaccharide synthase